MGPRCTDDMKAKHKGLDLLPVSFDSEVLRPTMGHELWIFDLLYMGGKWQGSRPYEERLANLKDMFKKASAGSAGHPRVILIEHRREQFAEFFKEQTANPLSEGLVLRRVNSKLLGDLKGPKKNTGMRKAKYRDIKEKCF
jgi:ATP-dependent DNA ligase